MRSWSSHCIPYDEKLNCRNESKNRVLSDPNNRWSFDDAMDFMHADQSLGSLSTLGPSPEDFGRSPVNRDVEKRWRGTFRVNCHNLPGLFADVFDRLGPCEVLARLWRPRPGVAVERDADSLTVILRDRDRKRHLKGKRLHHPRLTLVESAQADELHARRRAGRKAEERRERAAEYTAPRRFDEASLLIEADRLRPRVVTERPARQELLMAA